MIAAGRPRVFLVLFTAALLLLNAPLCADWAGDGTNITTRATRNVPAALGGSADTGDNVDFRPALNARFNVANAHTHHADPDFVYSFAIKLVPVKPALKLYEWNHSFLI